MKNHLKISVNEEDQRMHQPKHNDKTNDENISQNNSYYHDNDIF